MPGRSTPRSATPTGSSKPACKPPSGASATATTTPWPRPSTACTRPSSCSGKDRGREPTTSSSRPWDGSTGSTTPGCTPPWATGPQPRSNPSTTVRTTPPSDRSWENPPCSEPGAIQPVLRGTVQDPEVPARVPVLVRLPGPRPPVLRRLLPRVQLHPPSFRDRVAHPGLGPLRHRPRDRPRPAEHPDRRLPRPPRAIRSPTTPTGHGDPVLDQPARPRTPKQLTTTVSFDLTDTGLLPGPLAVTRTGLTPAGDDELQNESDQVTIGMTPLAHWAYSRVSWKLRWRSPA